MGQKDSTSNRTAHSQPTQKTVEIDSHEISFPIIAIGDSLTRGYYQKGIKYHPYCVELTRLLNMEVEKYKVYQFGVSGEQTSSMKERLPRFLLKQLTEYDVHYHCVDERFDNMTPNALPFVPSKDYRAAIIIGGTNDLAFVKSSEDITNNLIDMYNTCLKQQSIEWIIVCSIPSCFADDMEHLQVKKQQVNENIRNFVQQCNQKQQFPGKKLIFIDLMNDLNWRKCTPEERMEYWDTDKLHFTPKGSDKLAQIIFCGLKNANML
ncbi:hypothetical protein C9374_012394 [Naegleria lovaniensis]|uniref:SGNH hydrolase-type esterase domain-containing protein n=1 Tax=Naegleria lovaniensis TaxID=51637 RepID=A0AA88H2P1_NAELO|nr:uncharacterized protein C9374_012394 [Naegleria lovaniensis]KAG2392142.1 hypothetical protein C9374_012394 [Naegleria lovaniensis]